MKTLLKVSSVLAISAGIILVVGGIWGINFTYKNVVRENIVTPADARIPETQVRGPLTLHVQADIIRTHMLRMTGGKMYAEMPRQVPSVDKDGKPVLDALGKPVLAPNATRDMWITATTLITALHLGILTYVFSGLIVLFGGISIWTGMVFCALSRQEKTR